MKLRDKLECAAFILTMVIPCVVVVAMLGYWYYFVLSTVSHL